ncbi:hypothetical protein EV122DRAFT_280733 [Schizophyllum commune]
MARAPLPRLPQPGLGQPAWPGPVHTAFQLLEDTYNRISMVLEQEDIDPVCAQIHVSTIIDESLPLLDAIEEEMEGEFPLEWFQETAQLFAELLIASIAAAESATGHDESHVQIPELVTSVRTGKRGRPRKVIDTKYLREVMDPSRNITLSRLARTLHIHRHTTEGGVYVDDY